MDPVVIDDETAHDDTGVQNHSEHHLVHGIQGHRQKQDENGLHQVPSCPPVVCHRVTFDMCADIGESNGSRSVVARGCCHLQAISDGAWLLGIDSTSENRKQYAGTHPEMISL